MIEIVTNYLRYLCFFFVFSIIKPFITKTKHNDNNAVGVAAELHI